MEAITAAQGHLYTLYASNMKHIMEFIMAAQRHIYTLYASNMKHLMEAITAAQGHLYTLYASNMNISWRPSRQLKDTSTPCMQVT